MTKDTFPIGYCTNVHAGVELEQAQANLQQYAVPIRDKVCPGKSLPVGLWLSENAVQTLKEPQKSEAFRRWMDELLARLARRESDVDQSIDGQYRTVSLVPV